MIFKCSGSCRFSYSDPHIIVSYNRNGSEDWAPLEKIRAPTNSSTVIHLLHLSSESKGEAVRLRWHQEPLSGLESYESCWALDNILLINAAHRPVLLQDSLDPPDTANWLFFPGATIKHACQSEGNAMYFHGTEVAGFSFASTRDVDLSREEGQSTWGEGFESPPAGWEIWGAVYSSECGELESGSSLVFLQDGERKVCTPYLDTTVYGNLRLHFTMGGGQCDPGESHDNDVTLYAKMEGRREHVVLDVLSYSSYRNPSVVSVAIPPELQTLATQFCLEQRVHAGLNHNVWAIDYLHLLPVLPASQTHMIQFSINLGCGSYQPSNSVNLEFSANHGRSWSLLHMECLPELCSGPHLPHSTVYSSDNYSGWSRITIPLPNSALTSSTRFRWRQTGPGAGNMWAVDNVYVGPSCLKFCSGRGQCTRNGCKCDPGFSGPACEMASQTYPAFISESFLTPRLSSYHNFQSIRGAEVSFGCGVLASGKSLVFNKDSRRHLVTSFLDSTQARIISVELPEDGQRFGVQFRWWQPYHSGRGLDVWAIDEITMTSVLFNSISLNFNNLLEVTQSLGFYLGNVQPYCGHDWTLSFTGEPSPGSSIRYVETQSMQIGASYMIQFSLVMGCGQDFTPNMDNQVSLEYSSNHGLTWHLVQEGLRTNPQHQRLRTNPQHQRLRTNPQHQRLRTNPQHQRLRTNPQHQRLRTNPQHQRLRTNPQHQRLRTNPQHQRLRTNPQHQRLRTNPQHQRLRTNPQHQSCDEGFTGPDCHPEAPLSSNVMSDFESQNALLSTWQEVIGGELVKPEQGCGVISSGSSLYFSKGFTGPDCHPEALLSSNVMSDFESQNALLSTWQEVIGGELVKPEQGCGVISSGSSLYFSKAGRRQLVSWDLETSWVDFLQFYLRVGGETAECNRADNREEGVLLQYSNNGGITWGLLAEMYFSDFTKPRFVYYELPEAAKTSCTRFRWWQPMHSGEGYDQWAIDDIIILSEREKQIIPVANPTLPQNFYERPAFDYPLNQLSMWLMLANEGMEKNETFCTASPSAMTFGKSEGDRFAVTRDLTVRPGYTLQFKLNIGCMVHFSASAPVLLQCSHDAGRSWSLVREGCYPASPGVRGCEGSSRELREPSVFYAGDFEHKTRFRWIQESTVHKNAPPFALDGVYISEPCPNHCGGHGDCISGVCFCDMGYSGGQVGSGCGTLSDGKALYFNSSGRREARTVPLDTTNTRLIQFYIRIGSNNLGAPCNKPRVRNEGVVVQYSGNNGVTWHLLRELDFISFLEPQIITIELTPEAKTPNTAFRWWQPLHVPPGKPRYAESWDFHVSSSSFLQFEMSMGCSKPFPDAHAVQLQYSLNTGRDWHLLTPECVPPAIGCATYTQSSVYTSQRFQNWRRVTVYLPSATKY
ncbi:UNVERIFIED_CONTAM: hypothetical protein FKN15_001931 [Acipenser sinensis]